MTRGGPPPHDLAAPVRSAASGVVSDGKGTMDPSIAQLLTFGFLVALALVGYEMRTSTRAPVCAECPHCLALARARAKEQAELQDAYAKQWRLDDRDDDRPRRK